jgi:hypothetical protein
MESATETMMANATSSASAIYTGVPICAKRNMARILFVGILMPRSFSRSSQMTRAMSWTNSINRNQLLRNPTASTRDKQPKHLTFELNLRDVGMDVAFAAP